MRNVSLNAFLNVGFYSSVFSTDLQAKMKLIRCDQIESNRSFNSSDHRICSHSIQLENLRISEREKSRMQTIY